MKIDEIQEMFDRFSTIRRPSPTVGRFDLISDLPPKLIHKTYVLGYKLSVGL